MRKTWESICPVEGRNDGVGVETFGSLSGVESGAIMAHYAIGCNGIQEDAMPRHLITLMAFGQAD